MCEFIKFVRKLEKAWKERRNSKVYAWNNALFVYINAHTLRGSIHPLK